jgi:hypothetical protein
MDGFWKWLGTFLLMGLIIMLAPIGLVLFIVSITMFIVYPILMWGLIVVASLIMILVGLYCWYKWWLN